MNRHSPEAVGCPSGAVLRFYRRLEAYRLSTHGVILARGDRVFSECYFAPFTAETKHRMYSVSKTFVAAAVLFLHSGWASDAGYADIRIFSVSVPRHGALASDDGNDRHGSRMVVRRRVS